MKTMLHQVYKFTAVLFICLFFQTCKKDLIFNETLKDETSVQRVDVKASEASYEVTTFVSGIYPNGMPKVSFPQRICSAVDGNIYVTSPGGFVGKISADGKINRLPNVDIVSGIKAGANGVIYLTVAKASLPPRTIGRLVKMGRDRVAIDVPVSIPLNSPKDLAIAPDSTIYIVDLGNQCIVKVKKDGTSSVFAGKTGETGNADGQGESARFNNPTYIRYANDGVLWVIDDNWQRIRKITLDGNVSTFFTLNPNQESYINDVAVTKRDKNFNLSTNENAFISVTRSSNNEPSSLRRHQILHLSYNKVLTPITSLSLEGSRDGDALQATFRGPTGLTVNPNGIFVTDLGSGRIRKISRK